jgi:hypothetical protein
VAAFDIKSSERRHMAQKTSGEFEKEFLDRLKASTGKDLGAWIKIIDGFNSKKRNEVIAWLKSEHGFGHMEAALLAGVHANGGKPVYASTETLLENQFAKAAGMKPLFNEFVGFVKKNFPNAAILPKKTYISVLENREFGAVNIKPMELRIGLDLGDAPFRDIVQKAKLTGPMPRISHMVVVGNASQFDDRLIDLLKQSYSRCH